MKYCRWCDWFLLMAQDDDDDDFCRNCWTRRREAFPKFCHLITNLYGVIGQNTKSSKIFQQIVISLVMLSRSAVFQILTFRQYTSYCLNNTKVAGSIQPLTEMNTRNISWVVKAAGAYGWPCHLHVRTVLISESLSFPYSNPCTGLFRGCCTFTELNKLYIYSSTG